MPDRPAVLIMQRHLGALTGVLEGAYNVYRFWEGPPVDAAHAIRAIVLDGAYPLDQHLIESLPELGLIACFTSGYDGIDVDWARWRGLAVTHAPAVNHEDVADHALGLILASRRAILSGDAALRAGAWTTGARILTPGLRGQKLGVFGLGRIGEALARRAEPLGLEIAWHGPRPKPEAPWPRKETLEDLARWSDVLVLCSRADETNRGAVSRAVIEALGPQGLLVNVARGQLVDEDALIAALKTGRLGAAALDVYETEPTSAERWADVPNTILTPHTAGATTEAVQRMLMLLIQNLQAFFAGEPLKTPVQD
jgi:lactate dehydrogenase-like 2-hydroxyacid dehydrogenase